MNTVLDTNLTAELDIGGFLPLARMEDLAKTGSASYKSARPFPHIVADNFFDPAMLDQVLEEFPAPGEIAWKGFENKYEIKLFSSKDSTFGPMTRLLMYHLNSISFLNFLSRVTGIENLIPDPTFDGGGMHQIVRGGRLGIHADFNRHKKYGLDRRLNALVYLNKNWQEDYGGHLELWNREMTHREQRILPVFNRMVVFSTTDFTYHGHPDPLQCPSDMTRKSLALYYYTNGRPAHEISGRHSTLFKARTEGEFGRPSFKERMRGFFKRR